MVQGFHGAAISKVSGGATVIGHLKPQLWEDLHPNLSPGQLADLRSSLIDHTDQFLDKWAFP